MKERKKNIFIDVDGTLIDFRSIDGKIISKIYEGSRIVKFIDKILWWINDFDIIGYSNFIFYARMFLYSVLSLKNVNTVLKEYKKLYSMYVKRYMSLDLEKALLELDKDFKIYIVTRNMYADCVSKYMRRKVYIVKNKRKFYSNFFASSNSYIIGNNYMDDILSCYLLNNKYKKYKTTRKKTVPIYIGKSKLVKRIVTKDTLCFKNINECIEYLKSVVD